MSELITTEYAGPAAYQVGNLPCYDVRAWWVVRDESTTGRVKLSAGRELKRNINAPHVEFVSMDADHYKSPHINAMLTFRVLTKEQFESRESRRKEVHKTCVGCRALPPGQLVEMRDNHEELALCYTCWVPIKHECKVLHWINRYGKLQV